MKIISTGDFFGNDDKFKELMGITRLLKPDLLILTGDMFPPIRDVVNYKTEFDIQINFIPHYIEYLKFYSKFCKYILYISGDTESILTHEELEKQINNNGLINIKSIINNTFKYENYNFIGIPYVHNTDKPLKDWVRVDLPTSTDPSLTSLISDKNENVRVLNDLELHLSENDNINTILEGKIINDYNNIIISHFPPCYEGVHTNQECLQCLVKNNKNISVIFAGHSSKNILENNKWNLNIINENDKLSVDIYQSSQIDEILCYCFIILDEKCVYRHHPLERDPSILLQNIIHYKTLNDEEKSKGFGDTISKFLHTGVVGRIIKDITGLDEPCLDCKKRQELLNKLIPYN